MKTVAFAVLVLMAAAGAMTGQMPYPLASTYVAMAESGDGWSVTATAVGNTNGQYGHTISMEVELFNPSRTRSEWNSSYDFTYYSATTANMLLCVGGECEDGTFTADTYWSVEYCPVADEYMDAAYANGQKTESPFVYVSEVSWDPTCADKQNDSSAFRVTGGKSLHCDATAISLGRSFVGVPSGIGYSSFPIDPAQGCGSPGGACYVEWTVTTSVSNETTGYIHGDGHVAGVTGNCSIKNDVKSANLQVMDPCP